LAREVFVDSGAWLALANTHDTFHQSTSVVYPMLMQKNIHRVTTNLVIAEAHALIRYRVNHVAAMRFLSSVRTSRRLEIVYSNATLEAEAEDLLRRFADQTFSLTDAVSFVVMRQQHITEAFAFDHHFLTAGFSLVPAAQS
jgi:predicted nucleic acid-binding protein